MNAAIVASIIAASMLGSLHCVGMCGGLVAFATGGVDETPKHRALALAVYNGARGLGYVALGTAAGALGSTLDRAGMRIGFARAAGVIAGVTMIAWGVMKLLEARGIDVRQQAARSGVVVPVTRLVQKVRNQPAAVRSAVVGGCTAALPCGFLHAFLVLAAGTGSPVKGAIVTVAFWLGTLPALVGLGAGVSALYRPLRRHAPMLGAMTLVGFGLASLFGRWAPPFAETIRNADSPPCHVR